MPQYDDNFLSLMNKATPEYKRAKDFLAAGGVDFDTGEFIEPVPYPTPAAQQTPAAPTAKPEEQQRPERDPQEQAFLETVFRTVTGTTPRAIGGAVGAFTDWILPESMEGKLGPAVETAVEDVATQAAPAIASLPQRVVRAYEDMELGATKLVDFGFQLVHNAAAYYMGTEPDQIGDVREQIEDARRQARAIQPGIEQIAKGMTPDHLEDGPVSDALRWANGLIFDPPKSEGEKTARDLISFIAGSAPFFSRTVAGSSMGVMKKLFNSAVAGGLVDAVITDPESDDTVDNLLGALAPDMRDKVLNYTKTGSSEELNDLRAALVHRTGGLLTGTAGGMLLGGFMDAVRALRRLRVSSKIRRFRGKVDSLPPGQTADEALERELDELVDEIDRDLQYREDPTAREATEAGLRVEDVPGTGGQFDPEDIDELPRLRELFDMNKHVDIHERAEMLNRMAGEFDNAAGRPADLAGEATPEVTRLRREAFRRNVEETRRAAGHETPEALEDTVALGRQAEAEVTPGAQAAEGAEDIARLQDQELADEAFYADQRRQLAEFLEQGDQPIVTDAGEQVARREAPAELTQTAEDTAINYITAMSERGWQGYDFQAAARQISQLHNIPMRKARELMSRAESLAKDPMIRTIVGNKQVQGVLGGAALPAVLVAAYMADQKRAGQTPSVTEAGIPIAQIVKAAAKVGGKMIDDAGEAVLKKVVPEAIDEADRAMAAVSKLKQAGDPEVENLWRSIQSSDDLRHAMGKFVATEPDLPGATKYMSDAKVEEMVNRWGYSRRTVQRMAQGGFLERQVAGAIKFASTSMEEAKRLAAKVATGQVEAESSFLKQLDITKEAMREAVGMGSAQGRAFRLLQKGGDGAIEILEKGAEKNSVFASRLKTATTTQDLARIVLDTDTHTAMRVLNKASEPSWYGMFRELLYFNMLQRPSTQLVNIGLNTFNEALNIAETYVAAGYSKLSGSDYVTFKEAGDLVAGYVKGFKGALSIAKSKWQGAETMFDKSSRWDHARVRHTGPELFGLTPDNPLYKMALYAGNIVNLPGDALETADTFFKAHTYLAELYRHARKAMPEVSEKSTQFREWMANPPDELAQALKEKSQIFTHTADLVGGPHQAFGWIGEKGEALNRLKSRHPVVNVLVPFVKTATNATRFTLERVPGINRLSRSHNALLAAGGPQAELAKARTLLGGTILGAIGLAAADGDITGAAPRDPRLRDAWLAVHDEYSIKIPLTGQRVSYDPRSSIGLMIAMAADTARAFGSSDRDEDQEFFEQAALATSLVFNELAEATPILNPFVDLFKMMGMSQYPTETDLQDRMLKEAINIGSRAVVPGLLTEAAQLVSPAQKDLAEIHDRLLNFIPGYGAPLNLDAFGRPRYTGFGFSNNHIANTVDFVFGQSVRPENLDPVDQELYRLQVGIQERRMLQGEKLNTRQRNRILELGGPDAYRDVADFIQSTLYQDLTDDQREVFIKRMVSRRYDAAARQLLYEDVDLREKIWQNKFATGGL